MGSDTNLGHERCGLHDKIMMAGSEWFYPNDCLFSRIVDGHQMVQFKYTNPYDLHFN